MKKYIIVMLLAIVSTISMADIPKKFKVYSTGAGSAGPWCRTLVDSYNKKYDSEAILMIKPGTGGLLATLDMLKDPEFSVQCSAGMSEMFFNRLQYPTYAKELEMISIINMCCESPVMFNTRLSNSFNTLPELLASKKVLTIGHHTTAGKIIAAKIFNSTSTFVNFKSATDALPSIVSGDIDVYIDGGTLSTTGLTKSLGRVFGPDTTPGINLTDKYKDVIFRIPSANISSKKYEEHFEELNRRFNILQKDDIMTNAIIKINNGILSLDLPQSKAYIQSISNNIKDIKIVF